MKYESDILETIHENALAEFKLGLISEAEMREYDEVCLPAGVLRENAVYSDIDKTAELKHVELVTA